MGQITVINVTPDRYTQVPKTSHRDGPLKCDSLLELGLLTLLLSNTGEFKLSTDEIGKQWKEGRDAIRRAMAGLEAKGYVLRLRRQHARGRWETVTFVCAEPAGLDHLRRPQPPVDDDQGDAGDNASTQVAPTTENQASDSQASDSRPSAPRPPVNQAVKDQETTQETTPPPTPPNGSSRTDTRTGAGAGAALPDDLRQLIADVCAIRGDWSPLDVRDVLIDERVAIRPPDHVRMALLLAAADRGTRLPERLLHSGCPHWRKAAEALGALPPEAQPPTTTPQPAPAPLGCDDCNGSGWRTVTVQRPSATTGALIAVDQVARCLHQRHEAAA